MTRPALTGIGVLDASVRAIVPRPIPRLGGLAVESLEVAKEASVRFSSLRSEGPSSAINQYGWYTFRDANWYIFKRRLTAQTVFGQAKDGVPFETLELPLQSKRTVEALAIRVRQANAKAYYLPGPERWLLIERIGQDSYKYYVSNFPEDASISRLISLAHRRWTVEQGYQQLKEELGLDHFEGRSWPGLHHHIALCFMAFCFLVLLQGDHQKKLQGIASDDPTMAQRSTHDPDLSLLREDQLPRAVGFL